MKYLAIVMTQKSQIISQHTNNQIEMYYEPLLSEFTSQIFQYSSIYIIFILSDNFAVFLINTKNNQKFSKLNISLYHNH